MAKTHGQRLEETKHYIEKQLEGLTARLEGSISQKMEEFMRMFSGAKDKGVEGSTSAPPTFAEVTASGGAAPFHNTFAAPELFLSEGEFSVNLPANLDRRIKGVRQNEIITLMDELPVFDDEFDELDDLPVFDDELSVSDELDELPVFDEWPEEGEVHVFDVFDHKPMERRSEKNGENLPLLNVESENQALKVEDGGRMGCNILCPDFAWDVQGYKCEAEVRRVCLFWISELNSSSSTPVETDARLQPLLTQFAQVFKEPNTLTPVRSHEHEIPLKDGVEPFKCGELLLPPPEPPPQRFHDLESLPRKVWLQWPVYEIEKLRARRVRFLEYTSVFFRIFRSKSRYVVLMCSDQSRPSLHLDYDKTTYGAFLDVDPMKEKLHLRSLIDHSIVESFGGEGKQTAIAPCSQGSFGINSKQNETAISLPGILGSRFSSRREQCYELESWA